MEKKSNATNLYLAAAALLIVGAFLPWATVSSGPFKLSVSGVQGSDGYITIAAGVVLGVLGYRRMKAQPVPRGLEIGSYVAVAIALLLGIYNFTQVSSSVGDIAAAGVSASSGVGLWLTILGGAAGAVAIFMAKKEPATPTSAPYEPPPTSPSM